jgi:hypothetical protein
VLSCVRPEQTARSSIHSGITVHSAPAGSVTLRKCRPEPHGVLRLPWTMTSWPKSGCHAYSTVRRSVLCGCALRLERLAPLIPPPRAHQVRYFGILAPCASGRDQVVPGARRETSPASASHEGHREAPCKIDRTRTCQPPDGETRPTPSTAVPEGAPSAGTEADPSASQSAQAAQVPDLAQQAAQRPVPATRPRRLPWADLLRRVYGIEALQCECGKSMRVIAAITEPTVAKRIRECMGLPPRAPPLTPARAPGSAADAWLEEPADFDQSPPHDWAHGA